jgi:hypothetical protein
MLKIFLPKSSKAVGMKHSMLDHFHSAVILVKKTIIRAMYFIDSTVATDWFSTNRLTDSALLTILDEWKTTHNISYEEHWHELPEHSAGIPGLFG